MLLLKLAKLSLAVIGLNQFNNDKAINIPTFKTEKSTLLGLH